MPNIGGKCKILWKFTALKIVNKPKKIITFPCDQHLKKDEINYIIKTIKNFYKNS